MPASIEDNLRAMEQKNLRKKAVQEAENPSGGLLNAGALGLANRFEKAAENLRAWFATAPAERRPR